MKNFEETHFLMTSDKESPSKALTALHFEIERLEKNSWKGSSDSLKNEWKKLEQARETSRKLWEKQSKEES